MSLPTTIITVNLTDRTVKTAAAPPELLALYQGGRGLNAGLLRRYLTGRTDALSPHNPLLITAGRLTGSPALSSARVQVSAVSPLTGFLGNSNAGGYFGPALAAQGILSLVIIGQSATPVYLVVDAGRVTFAPASHLWGQDTYATRAAIPIMKAQGRGRIINVASAHGLVASPFKSAYVAAKHGVIGFTKTVALEVAQDNITCNAICPGFVETPIVEKQIADQARTRGLSKEAVLRDVILGSQPTKRFVTTDELAGMFLYLVSDLGASANGASFSIDGGWTAQ